MSQWVPNDGLDDANEGEENSVPTFSGREATVYLIDATIFNDKSQFDLCLECIEADLLRGILANDRDLVAVVLYNTNNSPPPSITLTEGEECSTVLPSNCAILIPLMQLSKHLIQYFKNFRESDDFFDFDQKYGVSNASHFSDALWLCSRLIIRCKYKLMNSNILLFSNNAEPHLPDTKELPQAFVRAKDLRENNITVELVPLVDEIDMEPFFTEFLSSVEGIEPEEYHCDSPYDKRFNLLNRIVRSNHRKSCLRHIQFELGKGVSMSCDVFSMTRTSRKPKSVKILRANNEVVQSKRSYFVGTNNNDHNVGMADLPEEAGTSDQKVAPHELFKSQEICGKDILFSRKEMLQMKNIQSPGLRLLGFKPLDQFRERWMTKACLFLYPNEDRVEGSTTLFRALWQKCLEKEKFALCTLTIREKTTPKYVALKPVTAEDSGNDGFAIIHLPVENNIGALDAFAQPLPKPTPEQVKLMEEMCKKLKFNYNCETFANPSMQAFYSKFEAAVYDEEPKEVEDLTVPDVERQDAIIQPLLERLKLEFGLEEAATARKRATDGGDTSRAKSTKTDLSPSDIEDAIRNNRMEVVTVQHIKDFIKAHNAHAPAKAVKKTLFEFAQKLID